MKIVKTVSEITEIIKEEKNKGTVGFVPTMGYLHQGHLSLVKKSKEKCEFTVVSIFVNPIQFNEKSDLDNYPTNIKKDIDLLESFNTDLLFLPDENEIYGFDFNSLVIVKGISEKLEGSYRPSHFNGVTTVVSILFNIIMPDFAFLGRKDAQQATLIKKMVNDLKYPIALQIEPTEREDDGLAMSSRNVNIIEEDRKIANQLYNTLLFGEKLIREGERNIGIIIDQMINRISYYDKFKIDYFAIEDEYFGNKDETLLEGKQYYLLGAARLGKVRLIDNIYIKI